MKTPEALAKARDDFEREFSRLPFGLSQLEKGWILWQAALAAPPLQVAPQETLCSWAERLRYVRRVMDNWAGNPVEDRANAHWEVKELFKEIHALAASPQAPQNAAAQAPAEPAATIIRGGTQQFGFATVLSRWEDGAAKLQLGEHKLYAHPTMTREELIAAAENIGMRFPVRWP